MAVDFRGHPMFQAAGFNAPTHFEAAVCHCEVCGTVHEVQSGAPTAAADRYWVA